MKTVKQTVFCILLISIFLMVPLNVQSAQMQKPAVKNPTVKKTTAKKNTAKKLVLKTIARYPHDKTAYTQGLIFHKGFLYESTGMHGRSSIRKVEISSGKVLQHVPLKNEFFAEGMERIGDSLYVLTWKNQCCFLFDLETLQYQKTFTYHGEGWGLTSYDQLLILSDGSSVLRFYDPKDFSLKKRTVVEEKNAKIDRLNELEMVEHELWANVWSADRIVRIDPNSGSVLGWINCKEFVPQEYRNEHNNLDVADSVLNGIAYDPERKRAYITGKNWPWLYELHVESQTENKEKQ